MSTKVTVEVVDFGQPVTAGTGHTAIAECDATVSMTVESVAEDGSVNAVVVLMEHRQATELARMLDEKVAVARVREFMRVIRRRKA